LDSNLLKNAILELKSKSSSDESFENDLQSLIKIYSDYVRYSALNEVRVLARSAPEEVREVLNGISDVVCLKNPISSISFDVSHSVIAELAKRLHAHYVSLTKSLSNQLDASFSERWKPEWVHFSQLSDAEKSRYIAQASDIWQYLLSELSGFSRQLETQYFSQVAQSIMFFESDVLTEADKEDLINFIYGQVMLGKSWSNSDEAV